MTNNDFKKNKTKRKIDPFTTIIPLVCILVLCA